MDPAGTGTAPSFGHAAWIAQCLGHGEYAPLGVDDIAELEREFEESSYAGGTFVFRAGDAPARVHVVRRGSIELSRLLGRRRVALQLLHAGDVFGDIPVVVRMVEPFDARAIEDSTLLSIDSATLFRLLGQRPRLARRWLVSVAERMANAQARLVELLAGDVEAQVATLLLNRADGHARVQLSQAVLASLLGVRRPSVNRVLKGMERSGFVSVGYGHVVLEDLGGLTRLATGPPLRSVTS